MNVIRRFPNLKLTLKRLGQSRALKNNLNLAIYSGSKEWFITHIFKCINNIFIDIFIKNGGYQTNLRTQLTQESLEGRRLFKELVRYEAKKSGVLIY